MHLKSLFLVLSICSVAATVGFAQAGSDGVPLTVDEIAEAGLLVEDAVAEDGARAFSQRMDTATFLGRVFAGREIDSEARDALRQSWSFTDLLGDFIAQIEGGGTYTYRGLVDRDGEVRARFRLVGDDLTVNYHDVLFSRDPWGGYRIDDFAPLSTGGDMSTVVGLIYEAGLAQEAGSEDPLHAFVNAAIFGEPEAAWQHFPAAIATAPEEAVTLHVLRLRTSYEVGTEETLQAADEFARAFPDHPTLHLNLIDAMESVGDFAAVNVALDDLERLLGEDAFLNSIRALVLLSLDDVVAARRTARRAFDAEPDLPGTTTVEFVISLFAEDYVRAVELMTHMESALGYEIVPADLEADPDLAGLVASEPYRVWVASRQQDG